jgi:hypothetical protein
VKTSLEREVAGDTTYWFSRDVAAAAPSSKASRLHLLPAFDEYLVGYRDRTAVLAANHAVTSAWGLLSPTLLIEGAVSGTWGRTLKGGSVTVTLAPYVRLNARDLKALHRVADEYGAFLERTASLKVRPAR